MKGWTMSNYMGSAADTQFRVHDGRQAGSAGRGVLSVGTDGSTDRALGFLATSNQISRFGASFVNDTGTTLSQFTLSYTGEQWRRGEDGPINNLFFAYGVTNNALDHINTDSIFTNFPGLDFTTPNLQTGVGLTEVALNGNLAMNQEALSATIFGLNWAPGSTLHLRWTGEDLSGQDNGLAIDGLSFSAAVPEPATCVLGMLAALGLVSLRRR
jgi:hypothetical protein